MKRIKGIVAASFTPMDILGNVNYDKIEEQAKMFRKNGIAGAFICGTTGECASLTFEEKKNILDHWARVKTDDLLVIAMLGGTCLMEMKLLAELSANSDIDGISVLSPYYFKPRSVTDLVTFCKNVADVAPQLPFYYYHIPQLTGSHFSMLDFLAVAGDEIPNLAGIKYTSQNIMEFQQCLLYNKGQYDILWGTDETLLSALAIGAVGAVGSTYNYAAPIYHKIMELFNDGEIERANQWQQKSVQLVDILMHYGMGAGKTFMRAIGLDCGVFRHPVSSPSSEEVKKIEKELKEIDFFQFCSKV